VTKKAKKQNKTAIVNFLGSVEEDNYFLKLTLIGGIIYIIEKNKIKIKNKN